MGRHQLRAQRIRRGAGERLGDRAAHQGRRAILPHAREQFLGTLRRIAPDAASIEVPYPNNRVELRYYDDERRSEILTGGVPGVELARASSRCSRLRGSTRSTSTS